MQRKALRYDKAGDQHYDYISAWIKSTRGSDPDASLYYLAAMLEGGEDARFIVRRMVILASEDVGNADPQALQVAVAAAHAVEHVGLPEATYALAQAAIYLSLAPKSNAAGARSAPPARTSARRARRHRRRRCARPPTRRRASSAAASATTTRTTTPGRSTTRSTCPPGPSTCASTTPATMEPSCASAWRRIRARGPRTAVTPELTRRAVAVVARARRLAGALHPAQRRWRCSTSSTTSRACWPRRPAGRATHVVLSELLPAARGLHTLADLGPRALADRRVIPRAAWLAGRSTRLVQSPVGVVGLRGPSASPWCEPALETAAVAAGRQRRAPRRGRRRRAPARRVPARGRAGRAGDAVDAGGRARRALPARRRPPAAEPARHAARARGRAARAGGRGRAVGGVRRARRGRRAARHRRGRRPGLLAATLEQRAAAPRETIGRSRGRRRRRPTIRASRSPRAGRRVLGASSRSPDADTAVRSRRRHRDGRRAATAADLGLGARPREGRAGRAAAAVPRDLGRPLRRGAAERRAAARAPRRRAAARVARARGRPDVPRDVATRTALARELRHGRESRRWPALRALAKANGAER